MLMEWKLAVQKVTNRGNDIQIAGNPLETVDSFEYSGAIVSEEGPRHEVLAKVAQTISAPSRMEIIWLDRNNKLPSTLFLLKISCNNFL